jgi:hypothetical protein
MRRIAGFVVALLVVVALPSLAHAQDLKDRFNIRLIAQGMYATEQQAAIPGTGREAQMSSPYSLAYDDLRAIIDARRLPGSFDLHLDMRVRMTGGYSTDTMTQGANQLTARGYDGGREYDLREAYVRRRGEKVDFALGRMFVIEADALKLDGARLWWRMSKHWDGSIYAGAYMDPFSRSLLDDYKAGFAFAGGVDTTYTYDKIWGSVSVTAGYLGGKDDGGPLPSSIIDPTSAAPVTGNPKTETLRTWITWTDYVRLVSWLDIFTDLVLDVSGANGVQLTRLDTLATARAGKHLTFHVGYDHLSSFAIEMWLTRFLASRVDHVANTIENNLVVNRTSRDVVHGDVDLTFGGLSIWGEGRFRKRAFQDPADDPQFAQAGAQPAGLAYDATLGLRERGTLAGLRPSLWGMYLSDYRSKSYIVGLGLGRNFLDDRLNFDLSFLYAQTKDSLAGYSAFIACTVSSGTHSAPTPTLPSSGVPALQTSCYGTRAGSEYELGLTMTSVLGAHWFALLDYRFVADASGGYLDPAAMPPMLKQPTVLTHVLLLRLEARY